MILPHPISPNSRKLQPLFAQALSRIVAATLILVLIANGLLAQGLDSSIKAQEAAAITTIADMMASGNDRVGQMLKDHGYQPANEAIWEKLPVIRQLEAAYLTFEKALPNKGGAQLLALLSSDLARRYQAVRYEPSLMPYISVPQASLPRTGPAPLPSLKSRPPVQVTAAIETIAQYCEGNAFGGTWGVLTNHFGLSGSEAYEILRSSKNNAEALTIGLSRVSAPTHHQVLTDVVADIDMTYGQSAKAESSLDPFRPQRGRKVPLISLITGSERTPPSTGKPATNPPDNSGPSGFSPINPISPRGGGGSSASQSGTPRINHGPVQELVRSYSSFLHKNHGTKPRRSFSRMTRTARGFGGVVFGSPVEVDPQLSGLKAIDWVPTSPMYKGVLSEASGRLVFRFAANGGQKPFALMYGPVLQEDVYAAERMLYGTFEGVPSWEPGEGVGLVGVDDPVPYFDCGDVTLVNEGRRWRVVLHPALIDSELGWSALMVDVLLIEEHQIVKLVEETANSEEIDQFDEWLDNKQSGWKYTDVPTHISARNTKLVVERKLDGENAFPAQLRNAAFLDVLDGYGGSETPFSKKFYQLVPLLARSSKDYDRLNRFAAVLALLRWAKQVGATMTTKPEPMLAKPTPESIIVTTTGFLAASSYRREKAGAELREKLDRRLAQIAERFSPEVRTSLEQIQRRWRELAEQMEAIYLRTTSSDEEYTTMIDEIEDSLESAPPTTKGQFESLRSQRFELYRRLRLSRDSNEVSQTRKQLEEAEVRLGEFIAATFPKSAEKEREFKRHDEERILLAKNFALDVTSKLDGIRKETRKVESALLVSAPPEVRTKYEKVAKEIADLEEQIAKTDEASKQLQEQVADLSGRLKSRLSTAPLEIRERYAALIAESTELRRAPRGTIEDKARLNKRMEEIVSARTELLRQIFPEYNQEEQRIRENLVPILYQYLQFSSRMTSLESEQRDLLKQVSPELFLWHSFAAAYLRTMAM